MKKLVRTQLCVTSLLLAGAFVAGAQVTPTLVYGTYAPAINNAPFAIATTSPDAANPRSKYVLLAQPNEGANLSLKAWQDTTSALVPTHAPASLAIPAGLAALAVAGLDDRVVTAVVDDAGALYIDIWSVQPAGLTLRGGYQTANAIALKSVAITKAGAGRVVVTYEAWDGTLAVQAWTIPANGEPAPEALIGSGSLVNQVSIATVGPDQVITASSDAAGTMYVNTWAVNSTGVSSRDQAIFSGTVSTLPQAVAVGAGRAVDSSGNVVRSAFTPFISAGYQLGAFYWSVAPNGLLIPLPTPPLTPQGDFFQVAAAMLPSNIPMTSYSGGTGDYNLFAEWDTGLDPDVAEFDPIPANVSSVASVSEGRNDSPVVLHSDFFVSAVAYQQLNPSPLGTIYLEVLSVPDVNPAL